VTAENNSVTELISAESASFINSVSSPPELPWYPTAAEIEYVDSPRPLLSEIINVENLGDIAVTAYYKSSIGPNTVFPVIAAYTGAGAPITDLVVEPMVQLGSSNVYVVGEANYDVYSFEFILPKSLLNTVKKIRIGYLAAVTTVCSNIKAEVLTSGIRIKDGTITANKIAAGSITADKIDALAITADKIDTNAITVRGLSLELRSSLSLNANPGTNTPEMWYVYTGSNSYQDIGEYNNPSTVSIANFPGGYSTLEKGIKVQTNGSTTIRVLSEPIKIGNIGRPILLYWFSHDTVLLPQGLIAAYDSGMNPVNTNPFSGIFTVTADIDNLYRFGNVGRTFIGGFNTRFLVSMSTVPAAVRYIRFGFLASPSSNLHVQDIRIEYAPISSLI
jgi:hypothetical protein